MAQSAAGFAERPIKVLLAGDEEPGHSCSDAPQIFIREASGCAAAFNCPKFSGGGADSAYMVMGGVPTVCAMGVKGGRNHSAEEYAIVETLFERAKLLALCVLNLDRLGK